MCQLSWSVTALGSTMQREILRVSREECQSSSAMSSKAQEETVGNTNVTDVPSQAHPTLGEVNANRV
jgi:hypothetical protein